MGWDGRIGVFGGGLLCDLVWREEAKENVGIAEAGRVALTPGEEW